MKGLYDNEMKLEFVSKTNNEAFARIAVAAFVSQLDPTIDELSDIKTAVSEAVTNSIIHGYEDEEGIVKITAKLFGNTVEIEVFCRRFYVFLHFVENCRRFVEYL